MKNIISKLRLEIPLILVICLGLFLQILFLDHRSLSYDEVSSIANASKEFNILSQPFFSYKPLYILILKFWFSLFRADAVSGRLLTILFGSLSIAILFYLGKTLFNRRIGLISAFFLSTSSFFIYHAQRLSYQVILTFLVILSFLVLVKYIQRGSIKYAISNFVINILLIFSHPYAYLIICAQIMFLITGRGDPNITKTRKWLLCNSLILIFSLLIFYIISKQIQYFRSILWWANPPRWDSLLETFTTFCFGWPKYGLEDIITIDQPFVIKSILVTIYCLLFLRGTFLVVNSKASFNVKGAGRMVLFWLILPIALAYFFSYVFFPVFFIKRALICVPAFYLIIGVGLFFKSRNFTILVLFVISLLNIYPLTAMYRSHEVNWASAVMAIRDNRITKDAVIVVSTCKEVQPFLFYFSNQDRAILKDISMYGKKEGAIWKESFRYKDNYIITVASELGYHGGKDSVISGRHRNYSCKYINSEFDSKLFNKSIVNSEKQIWLLISKWTGITEECLQSIVNRLKRDLDLTYKSEIGGISVFCFSPKYQSR